MDMYVMYTACIACSVHVNALYSEHLHVLSYPDIDIHVKCTCPHTVKFYLQCQHNVYIKY